jgi:membrane fusion protein, heavy metal efflux system
MATQLCSVDVSRKQPGALSNSAMIGNAKYFGILLVLLAIGLLGHQTHWSFGDHSSHPSESENPNAGTALDQPPDVGEWSVVFPSESSLNRSGIKTSPLQQRAIVQRVKTVGVVSYDERKTASLSARVSGTVWRVVKQVGDPVSRGDVLVIIDAAEVGRAKAEFLSELVAVETNSQILATLETVAAAVPGRQIREARVAVREASIRMQNVEQKLVNLGLNVQMEEFEKLSDAQRAHKIHFLGLPNAISGELDTDHTTSNLLALTASFDGVVIRHDAALGEMTVEGKPIIEISDLRRMWLKLDVPKEDASKLALGQRIRFAPDGIDQELESKIVWISSEMNMQTRTLQVRAEVENPIVSSDATTGQEVRLLRANTFGTGSIVVGESDSAFVIPLTAVLHADNQPMVFYRTGELSFARLDVKLGVRDSNWIQIESADLVPGMEIVTQGCHVLKSESMLNRVASSGP